MNILPFHVTDSVSYKNHKMIVIDEIVYNQINTSIDGSYNILFARLFGLPYHEFCRMVRDNYNAILHGKEKKYITFTFDQVVNANKFQLEICKRWWKFNEKNL